jgi:hypothetical protein
MSKPAFKHLLAHYRAHKNSLIVDVKAIIKNDNLVDNAMVIAIARHVGALHCLYWQALGNGEVNLAKGISRTISKAKAVHGIEFI